MIPLKYVWSAVVCKMYLKCKCKKSHLTLPGCSLDQNFLSDCLFQYSGITILNLTHSGMRIRIRSDPLIFDFFRIPTCNDGWNYFNLEQNINQNQQSQAKLWFIKSNFIPTYIIYKYIFSHFELRPDPDPRKKVSDPHPWKHGRRRINLHPERCSVILNK